jgi:Domain of unknown function (DUF4332)
MSYPITIIDEIDEEAAAALRSVGIRTTAKLLEAAKGPNDRKKLAEKTNIEPVMLLRWANVADKLRIPGMGKEYAVLLRESGVDTVRELGYRNPANLAERMAETNKKRKLVRLLPSAKLVTRWIEHARKLQQKITY